MAVEVRSVNHRYFDLKLRASGLGPDIEDRTRKAVRAVAERGAFTVTLHDPQSRSSGVPAVNVARARAAHRALLELAEAVGTRQAVSLELVAAQPGVLAVAETSTSPDEMWSDLEPAVDEALAQLVAMREREGAALASDVRERLGEVQRVRERIATQAAGAPEEHAARLRERLAKLLGGHDAVDPARLAQEVAIVADRLDVTEELVRLGSHLAQARDLAGASGPVGRRLDFLVQEMGRELNTVGAKSQSADIAALVVQGKAELERVREQIQNAE